MRAAFEEFVAYAVANPPASDTPGGVYGAFRQRVWGDANFTIVYELANWGDYEDRLQARFQRMRDDEQFRELWQAWSSHLVSDSCEVSFHQRWP